MTMEQRLLIAKARAMLTLLNTDKLDDFEKRAIVEVIETLKKV